MVLVVAIIAVVSVLVLMAAADMDVVRPDHCHSIKNIVLFSEKERRMGQYQRKIEEGNRFKRCVRDKTSQNTSPHHGVLISLRRGRTINK